MALRFAVVLATAHFENLDFVVTALRKNSSLDHSTSNERSTDLQCFTFADGQYLVKRNFLPNVCRYLFYFEFLASSNAILLTAGFYNRVHRDFP